MLTPIITDNSTAYRIINNTVKQKRLKAMDMQFYWLRDRIAQKQFIIFWPPGKSNTADYVPKHHPIAHHRQMRSVFLFPTANRPTWDTARVCYSIALRRENALTIRCVPTQIKHVALPIQI